MLSYLSRQLFRPADNAPLILFRIFFGLLLLVESWGAILTGWVHDNFIATQINFAFIGFEGLRIFHGPVMYLWYLVMGALGILIAVGFRYRVAMFGFAVMWSVTYLMQKTSYNNHYFLLMVVSWIMLFLPAHHSHSIDVRRGAQVASTKCAAWVIALFPLLMLIIYVSASLAKVHPDWLAGKPIAVWMAAREHLPLIGGWLQQPSTHLFLAYGGVLFDLLIVPLYAWRYTRIPALLFSLFFHLFNSVVFEIGIFPYFALALTVFFYPPAKLRKWFRLHPGDFHHADFRPPTVKLRKIFTAFFVTFFLINALLPLRHHLYPGHVNWTEEGYRLSWRMMLRSKRSYMRVTVIKPDGEQLRWKQSEVLTPKQRFKAAGRPDMIWTLAQWLAREYAEEGKPYPQVYIDAFSSLNGRNYQRLTDGSVDLAAEPWRRFSHTPWITRPKLASWSDLSDGETQQPNDLGQVD